MDEKYDPKAIEAKWQAYWNKTGLFPIGVSYKSLTLSDKII